MNRFKISSSFLCCFFLYATSVFGQKTLNADGYINSINLIPYTTIFKDSTKKLTIENIQTQEEKFKPTRLNANYGFDNANNYWIHFKLQNTTKNFGEYYIEMEYPLLDKVEFYTQKEDGWEKLILGDKMPFNKRPIFYKNFVLPLQLKSQEQKEFYIKVNTTSSVQLPMKLMNSIEIQGSIAESELFFGIFYGILLIMFIYNLVLFFAIRNKMYLYYCLHTLIYGIGQASISGHAFQYLWGNSFMWANAIIPSSITLSIAVNFLFATEFLQIRKYKPRLHKVLFAFAMICVLIFFIQFLLPYGVSIRIATILLILSSLLLLLLGIYNMYIPANRRVATYYTIIKFAFLIGLIMLPLLAYGILPNNFVVFQYSAQIGCVLETVGLSFALADRINAIRKEKEKAQTEALEKTLENARIIEEQKETLEERVKERTLELQIKQEEILTQNEELYQQREEIMAQRDFIETKNIELSEINQSVSQSIQYASTIQKALLPSEVEIKKELTDFFALNIPRDVVSGDFYWYSKLENYMFFAVVDCTGHGVPGAFMSMIGNTLLHEIVIETKNYDPATILELLNVGVSEALRQKETGNTDGMDVCLCRIENLGSNTYEIVFAGAKRPLFISQNNEIHTLKGSRKQIGGLQMKTEMTFQNQRFIVYKGDCLYLSSDGLIDVPNPARQKFGLEKLKTLLLLYGKENMEHQKQYLIDELKQFQQNAIHRDDIMFVGVKV
jgi:two-component system, sensor histidine kinase LadS